MNDRTVHAGCNEYEIVRYDRGERWYMEPRGDVIQRTALNVRQAAEKALEAKKRREGFVNLDRPGGNTFDRLVRGA